MIKHIIAYHVNDTDKGVLINDSLGNSIVSKNANELFDFLFHPYRDNSSRELKFFWNLDESLASIFRLMKPEECKKLLTTTFTDSKWLYYRRGKNILIKSYSDGKPYIIKRKNEKSDDHPYLCCIYGIDSLVHPEKEPVNAQEVLAQGQRLLTALEHIGITTPLTLNSAIGIYESSMRNIQLTPNIKCIPPEAIDILVYAKHCANRQGWITNVKVGHFKTAYDYDVNSSYGWWLSQVKDFANAEYITYSKEFACQNKKDIAQGNITGFFKVRLIINPNVKIHPFAYVSKTGQVIYPIGTYETYLTLEEMLAVLKYKVGSFEVLGGWYVKFKNYNKPMENIVNRLFAMRSLGEIENELCKGIIVGYVGKCNAQFDDDKTSQTYNPMIAGWIYAQARLQVFRFIIENDLQDSVIAVSTDGVLSTKEATVTKISKEKVIGTWRKQEPSPALVLSPGWIIHKDKKPHSITYEKAIDILKSNPNTNHYKVSLQKRVTLFEAVELLHDISMVGKITEHHNTIDLAELEMAQDRIFKTFPKTGKQLLSNKVYDSEPIKV